MLSRMPTKTQLLGSIFLLPRICILDPCFDIVIDLILVGLKPKKRGQSQNNSRYILYTLLGIAFQKPRKAIKRNHQKKLKAKQ